MTKRQDIILNTDRLFLSQFVVSDLDFLYGLHSDPEVMRYIGRVRSREEVDQRLQHICEAYDSDPKYGIWKASLLDGTPIGWATLKDLDGSEHIEIGYRLTREFWGNGYATELSRAMLQMGFDQYKLQKIVGVCNPENLASKRVLEKVGMRFIKMAVYYRASVLFFSISKQEWDDVNK